MKAVIIGGGIGGLTAALCCQHIGWDVTVLERASELAGMGAGIQISPNAMKVFEALGLSEALDHVGFRPEAIELRMGRSGHRLIRAPLGPTAMARWGAPYLHIHRADLIKVLRTALQARASSALQLGMDVQAYSEEDAGACALMADGTHIAGDVVIGADGIHSGVRRQMIGPDAPVFTGNVAWRAVVPVERLGTDRPDPVAGAWMGRGKHAVTYLLAGGKLANLVAVVERDDWTGESWSERGDRAEALADFAGWHPKVRRILEQADSLYRWALFDRPPLDSWTQGHTTLIGDAAHPMLPFMAQGAAMAIEDGWALAAKLSQQKDNIPAALASFETLRQKRANRIQAGSRSNAKTFHQRSFAGRLVTYGPMWLAGRIAPQIGLARQDPVYGYDIVHEAGALA